MDKYIDLNSDLGENAGDDEAMLRIVSSANIACGGHAGDAYTMQKTVELSAEFGVNIGAHPGFWDRENFGRVFVDTTQDEVYELIMIQTEALMEYTVSVNKPLTHIKPHGALYNMLMADEALAVGFIKACASVNVPAMGMPYSAAEKAARKLDVKFIREGFADRLYTEDGRLTSRTVAGSVLNHEGALKQAVSLAEDRKVTAGNGMIEMMIHSICVHGDSEGAVHMAKSIKDTLIGLGYKI